MLTLLTSDLTAPERFQAGEVLGHFRDPRFQAKAWYLPDGPLLGFVEIPEGPFLMGSDQAHDPAAYDHEGPQHEVSLPQYFIGRYPVTVAQFQAFVKDSGYQPQDESSLQGVANHPVVDVSWYDARECCEWLTERLQSWPGTPEPLACLLRDEGWQVMLPSEANMTAATRRVVLDRAQRRCEYCHADERCQFVRFTADHVQPQSAGGSDDADNLALACRNCNERRRNRLEGRDPETGEVVSRFNPSHDRWSEHLIWDVTQLRIVGQIPTGRVTVEVLDLNDDRHAGTVIRIRRRDLADGYHPPPDDSVLST